MMAIRLLMKFLREFNKYGRIVNYLINKAHQSTFKQKKWNVNKKNSLKI
jgi:hypothetical protein